MEASRNGFHSAIMELEDVALTLRDYAEGIVFDPARLEVVEERLVRLERLKKKIRPNAVGGVRANGGNPRVVERSRGRQ